MIGNYVGVACRSIDIFGVDGQSSNLLGERVPRQAHLQLITDLQIVSLGKVPIEPQPIMIMGKIGASHYFGS